MEKLGMGIVEPPSWGAAWSRGEEGRRKNSVERRWHAGQTGRKRRSKKSILVRLFIVGFDMVVVVELLLLHVVSNYWNSITCLCVPAVPSSPSTKNLLRRSRRTAASSLGLKDSVHVVCGVGGAVGTRHGSRHSGLLLKMLCHTWTPGGCAPSRRSWERRFAVHGVGGVAATACSTVSKGAERPQRPPRRCQREPARVTDLGRKLPHSLLIAFAWLMDRWKPIDGRCLAICNALINHVRFVAFFLIYGRVRAWPPSVVSSWFQIRIKTHQLRKVSCFFPLWLCAYDDRFKFFFRVACKYRRKRIFGGLKAYLRATDHTSSNIILLVEIPYVWTRTKPNGGLGFLTVDEVCRRCRGYPRAVGSLLSENSWGKHPNPSATGVELEDSQGGSTPLPPRRVSSSRRPTAVPSRRQAGTTQSRGSPARTTPTRARTSKSRHRKWLPLAAAEPSNSSSMKAAEDPVESRSAPPPPSATRQG
jgi:hypothetical protein